MIEILEINWLSHDSLSNLNHRIDEKMHYIYHEFEKTISTKRMLATRVLSISESLQVKKESDPKE